MAAGTFIIQERPELGGFTPRGGAVRFEWTAANRNAPVQPWPGGVTQRTKRTDYTGADEPTEQVLGPNFKPFTLRGTWLDKYNAPGYAVETWRAFLAMVRRGNVCEFSFKSQAFFGIITDFDWDYRREYDIGYSFTVSVHRRPGLDELSARVAGGVIQDASSLVSKLGERINTRMVEIQTERPTEQLAGDISLTVGEDFDSLQSSIAEFEEIVEQRILQPGADAATALRRAVAAGDITIGRAQTLLNRLGSIASDVNLSYQTALGVLDIETWSRGLAAQARLSVFDAYDARQQLDEQVEPNAVALYRPYQNESLYSISNRFYGTPHNWRLIKERNRLPSSNLDGTELLIIPEAPPS